MTLNAVVGTLQREDVLEQVGEERLALGGEYVERLEDTRERVTTAPVADTEDDIAQLRDEPPLGVAEVIGEWDDLVAHYLTLGTTVPSATRSELIELSVLLSQVERGLAPDEGAPDPFFPVHCEHVEHIVGFYEKAVVYVWREDCEPCDTMKAELEDIFQDAETSFGLYSVFGPEDPRYLEEQYNVVGGPTTLFFRNGQVDSRLQGAHYRSVIDSEVETLRNL